MTVPSMQRNSSITDYRSTVVSHEPSELSKTSSKFRNGTPTLHVPDTVRVIERKLKKEFEGLLSRSKLSLLSKQNDKDIETLKGSLDSLRTRFHTEEQELLAKLKPLENLSIKYKSQLLSFGEAKRAASGVKHESGSEADDMDSNGSSSHTPEVDKRKRKETHAEAHATQTLAEGKSKRTRVEMPSEPPSRREIDLSTIQQSPIQDHPRTLPSQQTSYASAERTPELRASSVRQSSTPIQRLDSNPPSGYSRREHRRRELLKHASGSWQVTHKSSLRRRRLSHSRCLSARSSRVSLRIIPRNLLNTLHDTYCSSLLGISLGTVALSAKRICQMTS